MLRKRMSKVTKNVKKTKKTQNGKRLRKTDVKRRKTEEKERQKRFKTRPKVTQKWRKSQAFEEVMMPMLNTVFPKVRSADHFWSAGIFNLVRKNENSSYFKLICYKKDQLCRKTAYFMVRRRLCRYFVVRQIYFPILWSAS